ncbi:aldose 1-epimerase [Paraburkholderia polaris]
MTAVDLDPRPILRPATLDPHGVPTASPLRSALPAGTACMTLSNTMLRLDLVPALGGGLTRFDWLGGTNPVPVFRRCETPGPDTNLDQLACYPLLAHSNRIDDGRSHFAALAAGVPKNLSNELPPVHRDGWLPAWQVEHASACYARLTLDRTDDAPYAYRAAQTVVLDRTTLHIRLNIENTGHEPLPFGLGLHPFLPRDARTELVAPASGLWLPGNDRLPVRHVAAPPAWRFGVTYPLPDTLVNHAFSGWGGRTSVTWPTRRLSLSIEADTDYYVLYAPPGEDYFSFEPVDHPIDAVNLPGGGSAHGMTVLAPGESLARRFTFTVERCGVRTSTRARAFNNQEQQ